MDRCREVVKKCTPSARLSLCLMVFWGQIQNYMMRSTLSLLIVAMVQDNSRVTVDNSIEKTCLEETGGNITSNSTASDGGLPWDGAQIGQVMGAFNIGYICTQVSAVFLSTPSTGA